MNRTRLFNTLTAAAVSAAALLALPVSPASALPSDYTITSGSSTTDVITVTDVSGIVLQDLNGPVVTCTTLDASGEVIPGGRSFTPTSPDPVQVTDAATQIAPAAGDITGCASPWSVTPSGVWSLGFNSKNATGGTGYLSGIEVHVHAEAAGESCDGDLAGSAKVSYSDATGSLVFDATYAGLTATNIVSSNPAGPVPLCDVIGIFEGDPFSIAATLDLSPAPAIS